MTVIRWGGACRSKKMALIQLKYKGASEIVGSDEVGLLILTTLDETLQLTIVCERDMIRQFVLRQAQKAPTDRMLPEVLWHVISGLSESQFQIIISNVHDGQYTVILYHNDSLMTVPMRASDAVLFSMVSHIPILIDEKLLRSQAVPYHSGSHGVAIPVNVLSREMLQKALDRAIADENYEEASHIRDEIRRRNNQH